MTTTLSPRSTSSSPLRTIPIYYRTLLRGQLTRGRVVGLGALAAITVLVAFVSRSAPDAARAGTDVVLEFGLAITLPLSAVLLATPMIGNLIEDRLLVYLWLKPVPRWHLAVAAVAAVVTVLIPVVVVPVGLAAVITGIGGLILPSILAAALGSLAYGAFYVFLGARFSWGLWLALVYVVLWENVLSRFTDSLNKSSIRSYLQTIASWGSDLSLDISVRGDTASVLVPVAVAVVATVLTALTLSRRDID